MDREGEIQQVGEADWLNDPLQADECLSQMREHLRAAALSVKHTDSLFQAQYARLEKSAEASGAHARSQFSEYIIDAVDIQEGLKLLTFRGRRIDYNCRSSDWKNYATDFCRSADILQEDGERLPLPENNRWYVKYLITTRACIRICVRLCDDTVTASLQLRVTGCTEAHLDACSSAFIDALRWRVEMDSLPRAFSDFT
jgi:hypothetical protein